MKNSEENDSEIETSKKKKTTSWEKFAKGCLSNVVMIIIFGLIGTNFMYFSNLDDNMMNAFFPSDIREYFSESKSYINEKFRMIGIPPNNGWPIVFTTAVIDISGRGFKTCFQNPLQIHMQLCADF